MQKELEQLKTTVEDEHNRGGAIDGCKFIIVIVTFVFSFFLALVEFGFRRVASIYVHKKLASWDKVLAFLLQLACSNASDSLTLTPKKHVALYWKPSPVIFRSTLNGPWARLKDFVSQVWLAVPSQNISRPAQQRL